MLLVTTALEDTWKHDEDILFLGEWCKLYDRKSQWQDLNYQVMPYHWDNSDKLYKDYQYIDGVYEKYLAVLAKKLNNLHEVNHGLRYWRIVIGPWLKMFCEVMYDRYSCIKQASSYQKLSTISLYNHPGYYLASDTQQFMEFSLSDVWNHYIYVEIAKQFAEIDIKSSKQLNSRPKRPKYSCQPSGKRFFKKLMGKYFCMLPNKLAQFVFSSAYFSARDLSYMQAKLACMPCPVFPQFEFVVNDINWLLRDNLSMNACIDDFERVLEMLLPKQLPSIFLEGYKLASQTVNKKIRINPKMLLTASSYYFDEGFKLYAAQQVEKNCKLAIVQHGGLYGIGRLNSGEQHQLKIADRFYSWGWASGKHKNIKPMPAPKLLRIKSTVRSRQPENILYVCNTSPRYSYNILSYSVAGQHLTDMNYHMDALTKLSLDCLQKIKIKLHPVDYGWCYKQRLIDAGFSNNLIDESTPFSDILSRSSLCISAYNSTTMLESMVANVPTLVFWQPKFWQIREEAEPYFERLKQAGIFHDNAETFIAQLEKIYQNPDVWWHQPEIQQAKKQFCDQYAYVCDNWLSVWTQELKALPHEQSLENNPVLDEVSS